MLWMSPRYGFIRLPDRFCTGSSIMPQKKNPDVPELARGKTGRVTGHLVALLMLMKAQPLAYNKDNQEDKEPLFDSVDTLGDTLAIFTEMVAGIEVDAGAMRAAALEGHATATDLADYLVKKGLPFRDAHEAVARAVRARRCARLRSRRAWPGRIAAVFAAGRRRCFQSIDAGGLARQPRPCRRHRAQARTRRDCARAQEPEIDGNGKNREVPGRKKTRRRRHQRSLSLPRSVRQPRGRDQGGVSGRSRRR